MPARNFVIYCAITINNQNYERHCMDNSSYPCYRMVGRLYGLSGRRRDNPPDSGSSRYPDNLQTGHRPKGLTIP